MSKNFEKLVHEAVEVQQEIQQYDRPESWKLSAKAFLREAMQIADTHADRLDQLENALNRPAMEQAAAFIRRCEKFITDGHYGGYCTRPPTDARRLAFLGLDDATGELASVGSHPLEAFALAVRRAAKKHPERFGKVDDWQSLRDRMEHLKDTRTELYRRISKEYAADDVTIGEIRADGAALITFTLSDGAVTLAPLRDAGERLVTWLIDNSLEKAA